MAETTNINSKLLNDVLLQSDISKHNNVNVVSDIKNKITNGIVIKSLLDNFRGVNILSRIVY